MQIDATRYSTFATPPAERRADPVLSDDNFGRRLADEIQEHRPTAPDRAEVRAEARAKTKDRPAPAERAEPADDSPADGSKATPADPAPRAEATEEAGDARPAEGEPEEAEAAADPIEQDAVEGTVQAAPQPANQDTPAVAAAPADEQPVDGTAAADPPAVEDDVPVTAVADTADEDVPDPAPTPAVRGLVRGHLHGEDGALAPTGRPDAPEGSGAERAGGLALQVGRELSALLGHGAAAAIPQPVDTAEARAQAEAEAQTQAQAQAQAETKPAPRPPAPASASASATGAAAGGGTSPDTAFGPNGHSTTLGADRPGALAPVGNDAAAAARPPAAAAMLAPAGPDAMPSLPEMPPPQPVASLPGMAATTAQPAAAAIVATPHAAAHHPAVQQVAVRIARAAEGGLDRIRIQLNPPELGRVDVRLEVAQDGRVQAVLSAERPDTLELLRRDIHGLEKALAEAGLKTDSGSLSFSLEGGEDQPGRFGTDEPGAPNRRDEADEAPPSLAEAAAARWIVTDGALDIHV